MAQPLLRDVDAAFGVPSRARICLSHTNRLTQWTKQINDIEDRTLRTRMQHLDKKKNVDKEREENVKKRLSDSVERLKAKQIVLKQHTMLDISSVVTGGDFKVAVDKFMDTEIRKALIKNSKSLKRAQKIRRRYERSRDDFEETMDRLSSMDLRVKSPVLRRRLTKAEGAGDNLRPRQRFQLPYLMLNTMLTSHPMEKREASEGEMQRRFQNKLGAAYDITVRASPVKSPAKSPPK